MTAPTERREQVARVFTNCAICIKYASQLGRSSIVKIMTNGMGVRLCPNCQSASSGFLVDLLKAGRHLLEGELLFYDVAAHAAHLLAFVIVREQVADRFG